MSKISIRLQTILILVIALNINGCAEPTPLERPTLNLKAKSTATAAPHIKHFGFTIVDTFWDDPRDEEIKKNYLDEVYRFSNIADILVVEPEQHVVTQIKAMAQKNVKAILHLNDLLFEKIGSNSESGNQYSLRKDYQERWDTFAKKNQLKEQQNLIQIFYIGEEPTWNGISYSELKNATDYVKQSLPQIPIMVIEAYPAVGSLEIPSSVDWVGFDQYFIKDPNTNTAFQANLQTIKQKLNNQQRLVLIMDTHYISWAHKEWGKLDIDDMKTVAQNYLKLANNEPQTIAILGYIWPSGFDFSESIGARHMPAAVQQEYINIGKAITKKP